MAERATRYLATERDLLHTDLVVAETVSVLESFYEAARDHVAKAVRSLMAFDSMVRVDPALLLRALELYETGPGGGSGIRSFGHRIDQFGSSFTLSPLTNPDGLARAACFHLVAGEGVGEHRALVAQLFCVVDGSGWVSWSDEVRTPIRAQHAAYWCPGEVHAAGTDIGMTAIVPEGDGFEVWANPLNQQS